MYPYLFQPILKEIIWGGTDIRPFKGMTPTQEKIGESWELSHVDGDFSVVAYGADKGKTIDELIREYGESMPGTIFPFRYTPTMCWPRNVITHSEKRRCGT